MLTVLMLVALTTQAPPAPEGKSAKPATGQPVRNGTVSDWTAGSLIVIATGRDQSYRLTSVDEGVRFDLDADGYTERVAWTEGESEVAFLARDVNKNGMVDNGTELFGNYTLAGARNGFEALLKLAETPAGQLTSGHPLFEEVLLWTDRNHNGISEPNELQAFGELFSGIGLGWEPLSRRDAYGNEFRARGFVQVRTAQGVNAPKSGAEDRDRTRHVYDVFLRRKP